MNSRRLPTNSNAQHSRRQPVYNSADNGVTTADGCVHTDDTTKLSPTSCEFVYTLPTRRDSTVSSRQRCELGLTPLLYHQIQRDQGCSGDEMRGDATLPHFLPGRERVPHYITKNPCKTAQSFICLLTETSLCQICLMSNAFVCYCTYICLPQTVNKSCIIIVSNFYFTIASVNENITNMHFMIILNVLIIILQYFFCTHYSFKKCKNSSKISAYIIEFQGPLHFHF